MKTKRGGPPVHFTREKLVGEALRLWSAPRLLRAMQQLADASLEGLAWAVHAGRSINVEGTQVQLPEPAGLLLEKLVHFRIIISGVVDRRFFAGNVFDQLQIGLVHVIAVEVEASLELFAAQLLLIEPGFELLVLDLDADDMGAHQAMAQALTALKQYDTALVDFVLRDLWGLAPRAAGPRRVRGAWGMSISFGLIASVEDPGPLLASSGVRPSEKLPNAGGQHMSKIVNIRYRPDRFSRRNFMLPVGTVPKLSRAEVAQAYAERTGRSLDDILFYYVFGLFKSLGVVQQIYYRFHKGLTRDPRFAQFIHAVRILSDQARLAIDRDHI